MNLQEMFNFIIKKLYLRGIDTHSKLLAGLVMMFNEAIDNLDLPDEKKKELKILEKNNG